ncbi:D-alanyl-D-alanine carboxypeptidase/D-alanyl-D-alanine endopeptidase [Cysteiniphilum sp. 6C5]|uniref:D-alanyl-D-alanine carboxypeptidase/D-alanyl-D-alanine endopeptidase n=1 Tax=unclassified Cysteiniphilum TaxID=2610889 RepID=UPI003F8484F6
MRVILTTILSVAVISLSFANAQLDKALTAAINANHLESALVAVKVVNAKDGKTLLAFNNQKNMMPASNIKLLTAAATLLKLGREYQYKTKLYYDCKGQKDKKAIENLYIDLSGDPSLTSEALKILLQGLVQHNIKSIAGNIYLINQQFQGRNYPINQSQSDSVFGFGAQSSAYTLNENQVVLKLEAKDNHFKVHELGGERISYDNKLLAASDSMLKTCQFDASMTQQNKLMLAGCLPKGDFTFKFAIANPKKFFKEVLQQQLKELGIGFKGSIKELNGKPTKLKLISLHNSPNLSALLKHMLELSDNLYAQSLLRTLGYKVFQAGSIVSGKNAMLEILHKQLALNTDNIQLEDGAGMSENDLLNADFIVDMLYKMQSQKSFNIFKGSLPVYGQSGTLKWRSDKTLIGNVFAKTGSGTTSSALSGYIKAQDGQQYIFSILITNLLESQKKQAYHFQDEILKALF